MSGAVRGRCASCQTSGAACEMILLTCDSGWARTSIHRAPCFYSTYDAPCIDSSYIARYAAFLHVQGQGSLIVGQGAGRTVASTVGQYAAAELLSAAANENYRYQGLLKGLNPMYPAKPNEIPEFIAEPAAGRYQRKGEAAERGRSGRPRNGRVQMPRQLLCRQPSRARERRWFRHVPHVRPWRAGTGGGAMLQRSRAGLAHHGPQPPAGCHVWTDGMEFVKGIWFNDLY